MLQSQRSLESLGQLIMTELTPSVSAQLGTFFVMDSGGDKPLLKLLSSYGYTHRKKVSSRFGLGEGLVGQAALEKTTILVRDVPDDYTPITSSLGEAPPRNIVVLPIQYEGNVRGVIELGSFEPFSPIQVTFLEQLVLSIGVVFNMISAARRTEELLEELKRSNVELGRRSTELEEKARELEVRNREIAEASVNLEEKARQLSLVSRYKSEFLANMSHELRTPLNSIIILSGLLSENHEQNLSRDQLEYAKTILSSGRDLLALISQILDLSKVEAGRMEIQRTRVPLEAVRTYAERQFRPIASEKNLKFTVTVSPAAPVAVYTDEQRLQQILKNLLSNAFKFTEDGGVEMHVAVEPDTRKLESRTLHRAPAALAFAIVDTGIGIAPEKQQIIFEAFQQADASTSRVYGGTGLGLTISRELTRLLGGEIHLQSVPGEGSTFTLYLPITEADEPALPLPAASRELEARPHPNALPQAGEEASAPIGNGVGRNITGRRILVVDDDVRNLFAITSLLERRGAKVLPASGAKEAFEMLEKDRDLELVLMDMMMPGVDGYEATRQLRQKHFNLPIIALTAKAMPGDREKALEAGCNDFVPKPVEHDRLVAVLGKWLESKRRS